MKIALHRVLFTDNCTLGMSRACSGKQGKSTRELHTITIIIISAYIPSDAPLINYDAH